MRIIAFEEHFTVPAVAEAHKDHPTVRRYHSPGSPLSLALNDIGDGRIAAMDEAGVDVQVLSQTTPGPETLSANLGIRVAKESNDAIAAAAAAYPGRFLGFASLPLGAPDAAVAELDRAINQLGFVGAVINGHVSGEYLDNEKYWPVLEKAADLAVPIFLHPTRPTQRVIDALYSGFSPTVPDADKVTEILAGGGWGWHADTALHSLRLITAGIFDRFPNLQIIIGHQGEFLPAAIDRAQLLFDATYREGMGVKQTFEEHFWIGVSSGLNTYPPFAAALHAVGTDRMLFSADYPMMPLRSSVEFLKNLPLSHRDKAKVAHRNAERLLNIKPIA